MPPLKKQRQNQLQQQKAAAQQIAQQSLQAKHTSEVYLTVLGKMVNLVFFEFAKTQPDPEKFINAAFAKIQQEVATTLAQQQIAAQKLYQQQASTGREKIGGYDVAAEQKAAAELVKSIITTLLQEMKKKFAAEAAEG